MTREEAIKYGKNILIVANEENDADAIDFTKMAIKALEQEPKIPHWNRGLPDAGDEYLVTVRERWGKDEEWEYETLGAWYTQDGWEPSYDIDEGQEWEIIAWMFLPEPYKAESEIYCNCTDAEIAKSFIEDVEVVKDLLPSAESEE